MNVVGILCHTQKEKHNCKSVRECLIPSQSSQETHREGEKKSPYFKCGVKEAKACKWVKCQGNQNRTAELKYFIPFLINYTIMKSSSLPVIIKFNKSLRHIALDLKY